MSKLESGILIRQIYLPNFNNHFFKEIFPIPAIGCNNFPTEFLFTRSHDSRILDFIHFTITIK